jgi:N-acetylglucosaminyldiphosphoundecaprenol N-acetyl-beta-D-mannosaminyltransferase
VAAADVESIPVIGLPVAVIDYAGAVAWCLAMAAAGDRAYAVEAGNTHVAALARSDPEFGASMAKFDLVCPDGMPLVWAVNAALPAARRLSDRVYGPTLMLRVIEAASAARGGRHFLLGGAPGTLAKLRDVLGGMFPESVVVDGYSPPFGEWPADEFERIRGRIAASGANFVWVGLGCPKQEHWIARHKEELPAAVYFGVGAAFAFHAGEVAQAPAVVQRLGLEWAYRLAREPRRLWRRYVVYNSLFLYYLLRDRQAG